MIPTRYVCYGDKEKAATFLGIGSNFLDRLKKSLELNNIKTASPPPIEIGGGASIRCVVNFGITEVHIFVPRREEETPRVIECLCLPHFALGVVESRTETDLYFGRYSYSVSVCAGGAYERISPVFDANFGSYYVGQHVLVTIGMFMENWNNPLDCSRDCLMQSPRFTYPVITPIYCDGGMIL